jgi:hypothetical protein
MWKRWLKYAKAKVDSVVRSADDELDRKEAELDARTAGKPWLRTDRDTPDFDDVKARIEHEAPTKRDPATKPSGDEAFDLAKQQRAADQRLEDIRASLDLDPDGTPPKKP